MTKRKIKRQYDGWCVCMKSNGCEIPISIEIRHAIGICGYIYIYPNKKCAKSDCDMINKEWKTDRFIVKKVEVSVKE